MHHPYRHFNNLGIFWWKWRGKFHILCAPDSNHVDRDQTHPKAVKLLSNGNTQANAKVRVYWQIQLRFLNLWSMALSIFRLIYNCRIVPCQYGPRREKTCLRGFANNTGADQPAHPCILISASVIRLSKRIISRLASSEISIV